MRPRISLSTSLGFGGCNAALVLEAAERMSVSVGARPADATAPERAVSGTTLAGVAVLTGWGPGIEALPADAARAAAGRAVIALGRPALEGERFRRATRECLLGVAAVDALLRARASRGTW